MRYSEGGGLTAERRAFREEIRLQVGQRFTAGEKTSLIAKDLRVNVRSGELWRRAWREGGTEGLRSAGPATHQPSPMPSSPCWRRNSAKARCRTASKTNPGPWSGFRRQIRVGCG
ncbi:helix-turn-helix domain-containing protein [Streptomyces sp. NPDC087901]|uniref:helix-turn-helix domain-containing protein n=1 Tax=Streptomyces sp. NPDC087901 TaxID=3365818 RepID=UPI0038010297